MAVKVHFTRRRVSVLDEDHLSLPRRICLNEQFWHPTDINLWVLQDPGPRRPLLNARCQNRRGTVRFI